MDKFDKEFEELPEDTIDIELKKLKEDEERYRTYALSQVEGFVAKFKEMFDGEF